MVTALIGIFVGIVAILFAKFVLPRFQEMAEKQAAEQKAKRDAKKAEKENKEQ